MGEKAQACVKWVPGMTTIRLCSCIENLSSYLNPKLFLISQTFFPQSAYTCQSSPLSLPQPYRNIFSLLSLQTATPFRGDQFFWWNSFFLAPRSHFQLQILILPVKYNLSPQLKSREINFIPKNKVCPTK